MFDGSSLLVLCKAIKQCLKSAVIEHGFLRFHCFLFVKMVPWRNILAHVDLNESKDFENELTSMGLAL